MGIQVITKEELLIQGNEILDVVDQAIEDAKADPLSVTSQKTDPFADANKLAADYGLTECGAS